jgi:hypothetical protein
MSGQRLEKRHFVFYSVYQELLLILDGLSTIALFAYDPAAIIQHHAGRSELILEGVIQGPIDAHGPCGRVIGGRSICSTPVVPMHFVDRSYVDRAGVIRIVLHHQVAVSIVDKVGGLIIDREEDQVVLGIEGLRVGHPVFDPQGHVAVGIGLVGVAEYQ